MPLGTVSGEAEKTSLAAPCGRVLDGAGSRHHS
jgi:hypothetical protein